MIVDSIKELLELPTLLTLNILVSRGSELQDLSTALIIVYTSIKVYKLLKKPTVKLLSKWYNNIKKLL